MMSGLQNAGARIAGSAAGRSQDASRLLAQIVSSCDLLQMEAGEAGRTDITVLIDKIGKQAMEVARRCTVRDGEPWDETLFRNAAAQIRTLIDTVQTMTVEGAGAGALLGEDLLSLQVTAHELNRLADSSSDLGHAYPLLSPHTTHEAAVRLLIVDDDEGNREIVARLLRSENWELHLAASGFEAIELAESYDFDLIMLDVLMPGMDGLQLLRRLRQNPRLHDVPVIMISGVEQTGSVVACLESGARDYVTKPFKPVLLRARLRSALEHRRMMLSERARSENLQTALAELRTVRLQQEQLLGSILPKRVAEELGATGAVSPKYHNDVTVVFTDFVRFTPACSTSTAYELVGALNDYFTAFDCIVTKYRLERLKTVGDAYMYVGGLSDQPPSHAHDAVLAAFEMLDFARTRPRHLPGWEMRIGVNTGPVVSGVVGTQSLAFDIWGDTVNMAARMVSAGCPGRINVSERAFQRVKELFVCRARGLQPIKGDRKAEMFFVEGAATLDPHLAVADQEQAFRHRYRAYFGYYPPAVPPALFEPRDLADLAAETPELSRPVRESAARSRAQAKGRKP